MDALIIYSPVVMKETGQFKLETSDTEDDSKIAAESTRVDTENRKIEYAKQYGLFTENTWNCEIVHEVEPRNDDIILTDRIDFSAFAGTDLAAKLKENDIKHFFVT